CLRAWNEVFEWSGVYLMPFHTLRRHSHHYCSIVYALYGVHSIVVSNCFVELIRDRILRWFDEIDYFRQHIRVQVKVNILMVGNGISLHKT
ncbi:hypothetical protein PFISCL1PPCAC_2795, partial [Pristionchus fissidentatus]